jgi:hypothetical protein
MERSRDFVKQLFKFTKGHLAKEYGIYGVIAGHDEEHLIMAVSGKAGWSLSCTESKEIFIHDDYLNKDYTFYYTDEDALINKELVYTNMRMKTLEELYEVPDVIFHYEDNALHSITRTGYLDSINTKMLENVGKPLVLGNTYERNRTYWGGDEWLYSSWMFTEIEKEKKQDC